MNTGYNAVVTQHMTLDVGQVLCPYHVQPFIDKFPSGVLDFAHAAARLYDPLPLGELALCCQLARPDCSWHDCDLLEQMMRTSRQWKLDQCDNCGLFDFGGSYRYQDVTTSIKHWLEHVCLRCLCHRRLEAASPW